MLDKVDPKQLWEQPEVRDKFLEWLGRDPHPTGGGKAILNCSAAGHRFEWHPHKRMVYLIREHANPVVGEVIAFNVETHGDAKNAVLIWLRGFNEGRTPDIQKPHLQV